MSTLLLTAQPDTRYIISQRSRARERISARLGARRLDIALARGACPDSGPALSMRARLLISAATRRRLSRAVRRVLRDAQRPHHPWDPTVPICRRKVLAATELLEELADLLASDRPVGVRGVAQVRLLITDGLGPLFQHPQADDLSRSLQTALDGLELFT